MSVENESIERAAAEEAAPALKREVVLPDNDRGRVATLVAMCSLAGVAVGFGLSTAAMQAASEASRAVIVTEMRAEPELLPDASGDAPLLGVTFHSSTRPVGARIDAVYARTPAAAVGLRPGDVIVSYDGLAVHNQPGLFELVRGSAIGARPRLQVMRGETRIELQPTLASMAEYRR